jgi:hypothetical protein
MAFGVAPVHQVVVGMLSKKYKDPAGAGIVQRCPLDASGIIKPRTCTRYGIRLDCKHR